MRNSYIAVQIVLSQLLQIWKNDWILTQQGIYTDQHFETKKWMESRAQYACLYMGLKDEVRVEKILAVE